MTSNPPQTPRLLLILTLANHEPHTHERSSLGLATLDLGSLRQGAYVLAEATVRSQALCDFAAQFALEGGIAWLLLESTPSGPGETYRPLVDRSEHHGAALLAWRQQAGPLPALQTGEMVRL